MSDNSYGPFYPQWRAGSVGYGPLTVTLPCVTDDGWISALVSARYGNTYIPMHLHVAPIAPGRKR